MAYSTVTALTGSSSSRRRRRQPSPPPITVNAAVNTPAGPSSPSLSAILNPAPNAATTSVMEAAGVAVPKRRPRRTAAPRATAPKPRTRETLLEALDRPFGPNETITPRQTALLAEAFGLPGITYSKAIVPGESNYRPGVRNPDDATPSLFQITPSVQSAETQAKFNKIASKHPGGYSNPVAAAKQAAYLARGSADEGVSNYVAFNPSAPQGHLPGGPKRARKLLGMPAKGATSRRGLSVNELYYDPGINISDGQTQGPIGGHSTHVHFGSDRPRDVLRAGRMAERRGLTVGENPLFEGAPPDPTAHTEGSYHYRTAQLGRGRGIPRKYRGEEIGLGIDVTGDPEALAGFNRAIARRSGAVLPSSGGTYAAPTGGYTSSGAGAPASGTSRQGPSLQEVLGRSGSARTLARLRQNPLAARAPQPRDRRTREEEPDEDEELLALLAALGEF